MLPAMRRLTVLGLCVFQTIVWAQESTLLEQTWRSAISNGNLSSLKTLFNEADKPTSLIGLYPDSGKSALMIAAKLGDAQFVKRLLSDGADLHARTITGGTAFMFASLGGHIDIMNLLHDRGADINLQGSNGWTALTIAAAKGYVETLKWLLQLDVDVNLPDVYGWTPLMRAVDNRHVEAVDVLLGFDSIDVNHQNETGNTAIHHAVANSDVEMTRKLVNAGIDVTLKNSAGYSAAQLAIGLPNSEELLDVLSTL